MKRCLTCKKFKPKGEFVKKRRGIRSYCRPCWSLGVSLRKLGITFEEYHKLVELQDGKCGICYRAEKLCIDHDHETGEVRGLLCSRCNTRLGFVERFQGQIETYLYRTRA